MEQKGQDMLGKGLGGSMASEAGEEELVRHGCTMCLLFMAIALCASAGDVNVTKQSPVARPSRWPSTTPPGTICGEDQRPNVPVSVGVRAQHGVARRSAPGSR